MVRHCIGIIGAQKKFVLDDSTKHEAAGTSRYSYYSSRHEALCRLL
jgi:hypothetical protein